ncbi:IseA DL-endopeptidase inhibitor family protein [Aquibacillus koreensis]|uniref:IseA DL-endopeptidase inhibitor family protein n=1 Tax=Aquibacillus koreensis TaxID=279446 RepID=A0A9X4AJ99_9BACI|nr:IseA DL-endopeptidase inhibitor family protein [Aquibacillus koreensis]MCT2536220.1 IseA DL-endopeptidase inhibitor family protein [Aquibacillus koreensis]MDC3422017.1 IseA DL-endopeptidase inhibitor family protein [Aquibacillus koreensis]
MKKIIYLSVFLNIVIALQGCSNEEATEEDLSTLKQENQDLIEGHIEMETEIADIKDKLDELLQSEESQYRDGEVSEDDIKTLLTNGKERFFHVQSGGDIKEVETVEYNGEMYRYLGEDLNTDERLTVYLTETFTQEVVNEVINELNIVEIKGMLTQPIADRGSILEWGKANYQSIELAKATIKLNLNVPLGDTGEFEEEIVELKYIEGIGWRINSLL